ncbi:helix-turn-helix transcriptional regulator [Streptomyces sp. NPDC001795]|uniref:helix-turn-helix transcriptional regulator n=1 Tax=Streptomyces sp. NPDC001795 TaxID=3154525 RepID=UPI003325BC71
MSPYDGARARALRLDAQIGIEELATAGGVSANTVRSAESGHHQPRPRVANAIARALGVPLDELAPPGPALTLCDVRRRLVLTQAEIADKLGVVRQRVSQVERGVTEVPSPQAWAAAYGLSTAQWVSVDAASRDLVRQHVAERARKRRETDQRGNA